jgi:hypothetical protein
VVPLSLLSTGACVSDPNCESRVSSVGLVSRYLSLEHLPVLLKGKSRSMKKVQRGHPLSWRTRGTSEKIRVDIAP